MQSKREILSFYTIDNQLILSILYLRPDNLCPLVMKVFALTLAFIFVSTATLFSQQEESEKHDQQVFDSLFQKVLIYYHSGQIDSMPHINRQLLELAQKLDADSDRFHAYNAISNYFYAESDFGKSLNYMQKAADNAEKGYRERLSMVYGNIGIHYGALDNVQLSLHYLRKAQQYANLDKRGDGRISADSHLAVLYCKLNEPDSALKYIELAERLNRGTRIEHDFSQANILMAYGQVYEYLKEPELVNYYYRKGLRFCDSLNLKLAHLNILRVYSRYLFDHGQNGASKRYAILAYADGKTMGSKKAIIEATDLLYHLYERQQQEDSAFFYLRANHLYQDSLLQQQKIGQLQLIIVNQQIKETEQSAKAVEDAEQRRHNIQYAAMAFGLIFLTTIFLLLSRTIIVNTRLSEIVGVIGLLIVFEFIYLVLHPFLSDLTHGSPLLMLLILVLVAAVVVPLHHKLEGWITHKLVEKNKAIRLAAAKRTIEKLEAEGE